MGINIGGQIISILYHAAGNSSIVNYRHKGITKTGIYSGGYLSIVDASHAEVSPFIVEIQDGTHQVRAETTVAVNVAVSSVNLYVVLRWAYTGSQVNDYAEIIATSTPLTYDIIVGKCVFTGGGVLNGFSYSDAIYPRVIPNVMDLFLKVEPTGNNDLRVRIRTGSIHTPIGNISVPDQVSNLFIPPGSNSKIYLVYIDPTTGSVTIDTSGVASATPIAPAYDGNIVLAEVTLSSTDTEIAAANIKDVRAFINRPLGVDNTTLKFNADGKLYIFHVPENTVDTDSVIDGAITPAKVSSFFGSRTNLDSIGGALAKTNVYRVTSDGFVTAWVYINIGQTLAIYTDANNPPTTMVGKFTPGALDDVTASLTIPIRKNDYWKMTSSTGTPTVYWLPLGSGSCVKQ